MTDIPQWLLWARELEAVAQIGLTFSHNPYDTERYEQMRNLAARIMAAYAGETPQRIEDLFRREEGYLTPKVDVRGAIFRGKEVLLVQEMIDGGRWTLPGGWADVNSPPSDNAVREVQEEAGLIVKTTKLAAVYDRDKSGYTKPYPFHIYKLFFLCEVVGETKKKEGETGETRYFPIDALPELSLDRVLPWQLRRLYEHSLNPHLPTDYD